MFPEGLASYKTGQNLHVGQNNLCVVTSFPPLILQRQCKVSQIPCSNDLQTVFSTDTQAPGRHTPFLYSLCAFLRSLALHSTLGQLQLALQQRMTLTSCRHLPSAGITVCVWLCPMYALLGLEPRALYQIGTLLSKSHLQTHRMIPYETQSSEQ